MIYIAGLFLLIFTSLIEITKGKRIIKDYTFICLSFIGFAGLRMFPYKDDFRKYMKLFMNVGNFDPNTSIPVEIGYLSINNIVRYFTDSFTIFLMIVASISIFPKFLFLKKRKAYLFTSLLIFYTGFYVSYEMIAMRQAIAMGILILFSSEYYLKNKIKLFILSIFIASLFHVSSIFFILVWFFPKQLKTKNYLILLVIFILIGKSNLIVFIVNKLIDILGGHSRFFEKLSYYLVVERSKRLSFGFLKKITFIGIYLMFRKKIAKKFKNSETYFNIVFIGYSLSFIFESIPDLQARVPGIFEIFEIVVLPYMIFSQKKIANRLILGCIIITSVLLKFLLFYNQFYQYIIPYRS